LRAITRRPTKDLTPCRRISPCLRQLDHISTVPTTPLIAVSAQNNNDNALFAQRTTTDYTSRTGPPGGPEEGKEEIDSAEAGGRGVEDHGNARAASELKQTDNASSHRRAHRHAIALHPRVAAECGRETLMQSPGRYIPRLPELSRSGFTVCSSAMWIIVVQDTPAGKFMSDTRTQRLFRR
jgi:hypothetical protein